MLQALQAIARAVLLLLRIVFALISIPFAVVSLAFPWRTLAGIKMWSDMDDGLNGFTFTNFRMFFYVIADLFTLVIFFITLVTWRGPWMVKRMSKSSGSEEWDGELRFPPWEAFGRFLTEIPVAIAVVLITVMFWHAPLFYYRLYNGVHTKKDSPKKWVFQELAAAGAEFLCVPFGLLILLTGYRIRPTYAEFQRTPRILSRIFYVLEQGVHIFIDFGILLLALPVVLTVLRLPALYTGVRDARQESIRTSHSAPYPEQFQRHVQEVRKAVLQNLLLLPRELLGALAYCLLLPTVYRFYLAFASARDKCGDEADPTPHTELLSIVPEFPENGVKLHLKGLKTTDLKFTKAKLYLRDELFWKKVEDAFGGGMTLVAKSFLPLDLCPKGGAVGEDGKRDTLLAADFKEGETEFETTLFFDLPAKKKTICKKLLEIGKETHLSLVVEFGSNHDGTLFELQARIEDLISCAEEGKALPAARSRPQSMYTGGVVSTVSTKTSAEIMAGAKKVHGPHFCDVMTMPALIQLALFASDVLGLIFFVLMHVFFWRAYAMYKSMFASPEELQAQKVVRQLQKLVRALEGQRTSVQAMLLRSNSIVDKLLKPGLLRVPTPSRGQYYSHSYSYMSYYYRCLWNDDYTDYITPSPEDAGAIEKLFDALATHATRFEELGEDDLAAMVRRLQDALYRSHAHYCVFGIERWRQSDSYAELASSKRRHNRHADSETSALDDMCPWLLTIRNGLNARTANSRTDCKESERSNDGDAPEAEVVDVLKLPYQLTLTKGTEGTFDVLPRASEIATAAAERHYNESAAALDTETDEVLTALRARLAKKGQPAQASADAPKRKSIGWSGVKKQVLTATKELAIDTAAVLSVLLVVVTLYRIPVLFASMQKRLPYGASWRTVAMDNVLEIPVDLLYCAKVLLIFLAIRSVPSFLGTFTQQVSKKKTFESARKIVDYYCMLAWVDVLSLVTLIFSARALKWGIASVATGALTPGVLVERAFFPDCDNAFVAVSFVLAAAGYLYALPVIFFTQDADITGTPLAVIILPAGLLALAALYLVVETLRSRARLSEGGSEPDATAMVEHTWIGHEMSTEKEEPEDYEVGLLNVRFVRMNWFNATQFLTPLLEAVFLVALVGKIAGASSDIADGSHGDDTFRKLFSYAFLEFHVGGAGASCVNYTAVGNETLVAELPVHDCANSTLVTDGSAAAYPLGLWVALGCVVVYYFLISLPVVIAVVRDEWSRGGICSQNAWVFLMLLLGYPMQIFIVYNLTSFVVCEDGGAGHSVLQFDEDVQCYVGTHAKVGKLALVALLFYVLTSLVKDAEFSTSRSVLLDVASLDLYELYVRVAMVAAAFLGVVLRDSSTAVACVVATAAAWCAFWTLYFPWAFEVDRCVSVASYRLWRAYCYAGAVVGVVSVKVAHVSDSVNTMPGWIVFGVLMFLLTAALAYQLYRLSHETTEGLVVTPEQVQEELLTVHGTLAAQKQLGEQFNAAAWSSFVTDNVRSSQLALALMQLEHHTCLSGLDPLFLSLRKPWYFNVWRLVDEQDLRGSFMDRVDSYYYSHDADDHFGGLFCDCFCSCSEYHYSRYGTRKRRRVNTVLDTPLLFELIKRFGNGVAARGNEMLEDDVENQHSSASGSSCTDSVGTPPEEPLRSSLVVDSINEDRPTLSLPSDTPAH